MAIGSLALTPICLQKGWRAPVEFAIRSAGDVCFLEDRTPAERPMVLDTLAF
jgi:hypothetical protein